MKYVAGIVIYYNIAPNPTTFSSFNTVYNSVI